MENLPESEQQGATAALPQEQATSTQLTPTRIMSLYRTLCYLKEHLDSMEATLIAAGGGGDGGGAGGVQPQFDQQAGGAAGGVVSVDQHLTRLWNEFVVCASDLTTRIELLKSLIWEYVQAMALAD